MHKLNGWEEAGSAKQEHQWSREPLGRPHPRHNHHHYLTTGQPAGAGNEARGQTQGSNENTLWAGPVPSGVCCHVVNGRRMNQSKAKNKKLQCGVGVGVGVGKGVSKWRTLNGPWGHQTPIGCSALIQLYLINVWQNLSAAVLAPIMVIKIS